MADFSMDVAAANRFISSLSKSLQALCHGCMDFDAGIEIVGYINVNIDSGSKVDYVLNEKVLKSTTNSMTFVSNSFLAKKEQPKQCRDGSCSPILELNQPPPPTFPHRTRGGYSYPASQHYRSSGIYSPHSQVLRGSQKRAWPGSERDWRTSPRKHPRDVRPPHNMHSQLSPQSSLESSTSQSIPPSPHFLSSQPDSEKTDQPTEINIKKELVEDQDSGSGDPSNQTSTNQENGADGGTVPENVNVKQDPDSLPAEEGVSKFENSTDTLSQADLSSSFLQQPQAEGEETNKVNNDNTKPESASADDSNADVTFGDVGESSRGADVHGEKNYANDPNNTGAEEGGEESFGMDADYEGAGEDMFSQPSFSGEGSSGGGQFEVIEIDDEDEDVQAMFNEARKGNPRRGPNASSEAGHLSSPKASRGGHHQNKRHSIEKRQDTQFHCDICSITFSFMKDHQRHMNFHHRDQMTLPYVCGECQMGFYSKIGLKEHEIKHSGIVFPCPICPSTFTIKKCLKRHLAQIHLMKQCPFCGSVYGIHTKHICSTF